MKWIALDSAREFGSLIQSGDWYIRHMTVGFGISTARAYRLAGNHRETLVAEFSGKNALDKAQEYAAACEAKEAPK